MSVQIINLRTKQAYDFRCDRQSPVGNPYFMHNEGERDLVCEKYLKLFDRIMHDDSLADNAKSRGMTSTVKEFRDYIHRIKQPNPIFPIIIAAREAGVAAGLELS